MTEMFIAIAFGIIVGLWGFLASSMALIINPKFIEWYTKRIMIYFKRLNEIDFESLEKEINEAE